MGFWSDLKAAFSGGSSNASSSSSSSTNKKVTDPKTGKTYDAPSYSSGSSRGLTSTDPANVARNREANVGITAASVAEGQLARDSKKRRSTMTKPTDTVKPAAPAAPVAPVVKTPLPPPAPIAPEVAAVVKLTPTEAVDQYSQAAQQDSNNTVNDSQSTIAVQQDSNNTVKGRQSTILTGNQGIDPSLEAEGTTRKRRSLVSTARQRGLLASQTSSSGQGLIQ